MPVIFFSFSSSQCDFSSDETSQPFQEDDRVKFWLEAYLDLFLGVLALHHLLLVHELLLLAVLILLLHHLLLHLPIHVNHVWVLHHLLLLLLLHGLFVHHLLLPAIYGILRLAPHIDCIGTRGRLRRGRFLHLGWLLAPFVVLLHLQLLLLFCRCRFLGIWLCLGRLLLLCGWLLSLIGGRGLSWLLLISACRIGLLVGGCLIAHI